MDDVRAANPVSEIALASADLVRALDLLGDEVRAVDRARARPRRGFVALAFAVVALVITAVALGRLLTAHTGFFPAKPGTENDTSEFLRTDAPDFPPLVAKLVRDIPFPPGDSALSRVATYVGERQPGPDGVPETVQAAGIKGTFSLWAVCAWRGYWLREHSLGSRDGEAAGAAGLAEVASSQALRKTDSAWPLYLRVARAEAAGTATAPPEFEGFYRVTCAK
jgi:hypothetical protein